MTEKFKKLFEYEIIIPVIMSIFALTYLINVSDKPRTGRLFPEVVCIVMLVLLARILVINVMKVINSNPEAAAVTVKEKAANLKFSDRKGLLLLTFIGMMFLYYVAIVLVGYFYSTFLFTVSTMYVLGYRKKKVILIVSLVFLLVIYAFFVQGFHFVLPQGYFFEG